MISIACPNFRRLATLLGLAILVPAVYAQVPVWRGVLNTTSPAQDSVVKSLDDSAGNTFVVTNQTGYVVVTKLSPTNTVLWKATFASKIGTEHLATSAVLDASGHVLVLSQYATSSLKGAKGRVNLTRLDKTTGAVQLSTHSELSNGDTFYPSAVGLDSAKNIYVWTGSWSVAKFTSAGKLTWHHTYVEPMNGNKVWGFAVDPAGNSYLSGYVSNSGNESLVVRKVKPDGTLGWVFNANDAERSEGQQVAVSTNSVYVAGQSWNALGTPNRDWMIAALSPETGQSQWVRRIALDPLSRNDIMASIVADAISGDPLVVGSSDFNDVFGLRLDGSNGNTKWLTRVPPDNERQIAVGGVADGTGGLIALAQSGPLSSGRYFRVMRLSSAGAINWTSPVNFPGLQHDTPISISVNPALGGVTASGIVHNGPWNLNDAFVARLNYANGAVNSTFAFGEIASNPEGVRKFAVMPDGGWAVLGMTRNPQYGDHPVIARFEANGALRWSTTLPNFPGHIISDAPLSEIAVAKDGSVIVAGTARVSSTNLYALRLHPLTGAVVWERTYDGPDQIEDQLDSLVVDNKGNALLVARNRLYSSGTDVLIWKIAPSGATVWMKRYDTPDDISSTLMAKAALNSDVVVYGRAGINNSAYPFILRVAALDGTLLWRVPFGGASNQGYEIYGLETISKDDFIVVGQAKINGTEYRRLISRIRGSDGANVWQNILPSGSPTGDPFFDAAKNPILVASHLTDIVVSKYSAVNGALIWTTTLDGVDYGDDADARGVAFDPFGNVLINGVAQRNQKWKAFVSSLSAGNGAQRWAAFYPEYNTDMGNPRGITVGADNEPVWIGSDGVFGFEGGNGNIVLTKFEQPPVARTFTGSAALQSFAGDKAAVTLTVEVRPAGSTTVLQTKSVTLAADGTFSIPFDLYDGRYDLVLGSRRWLRKRIIGVSATDLLSIPLGTQKMLGGDCNGDNKVDESDRQILLAALGSTPTSGNWNPDADLDGNLVVNSKDQQILTSNLGKTGA